MTVSSPADTHLTPALRRTIEEAQLVSFDVFDTLITRPLLRPEAVFDLVARRAAPLLKAHAEQVERWGGFRALRQEAAREAAEAVRSEGSREEYDLLSVYQRVCARLEVPTELASKLQRVEEEVELALHRPRSAGKVAFEATRAAGKRVVLISDMYLPSSLVAQILAQCGYSDYAALYVSSEYGLLKRTGKLFERVRELEGKPRHWLHLGDHRVSDVQVPTRLGLQALHLPNVTETYLAAHARALHPREALGNTLGSALLHGVVSRKFYDRPGVKDASFEGSPYRLGYEAGGPLMLAFTQWVLQKSRRDGLSDVYFLARDGFLPHRLFGLLTRDDPSAPRSHYVYASRRALSVAALRSEADIIASLVRMSKASVAHVLRHRFGIDPQQLESSCRAAGFASLEERVSFSEPKDRKRLERLLRANSKLILAQAERERVDYRAYLRSIGMYHDERSYAVVDIGHNASLQVALSKLLGRGDVRGYYFATFEPARAVHLGGLDVSSYLIEFEDSIRSDHVYCANVGLFEFLFLPAVPSLERVARNAEKGFEPVFVKGDESKRFAVVAEVHRGVMDFAQDMLEACGGDLRLFSVSKNEAIASFARFAQRPTRQDARLLANVSFVDAFAGNERRYLIAPSLMSPMQGATLDDYRAQSWWTRGAEAAYGRVRSSASGPMLGAAWGRKVRKLLRDPEQFVRDMKLLRRRRER